jgi:hypothetical protein
MAAKLAFCLLVAATLLGCPFAECPPNNRTLADGGSANGLAPDRIVAPLLGDHVAALTWLVPNRTTTLHLVVERVGSDAVLYDCDNNFHGFEVDVTARVYTEDGLVDSTIGASQSTLLEIDASGYVPDPQWSWNVDVARLRAAGVVDPSVNAGFVVEISASIQKLKPIDGTLQAKVAAAPSIAPVTVGTFRFSS